MILIPFITYILSVVSEVGRPYSATIRDNKLIAIYRDLNLTSIKVKVFELKEGATMDMFKSGKTTDYGRIDREFGLVFMDIPDSVQDDKNKLWLKPESFQNYNYNNTNSPFMNWMGCINLDDMSLENHSGFIEFPTHEKFPVKGYTINKVDNEYGSVLYITGGAIYSKIENRDIIESSFYKYNFTTREWVDMAYLTNRKLKPLFGHKSLILDNRYLIVLGGFTVNSEDSPENIGDKSSLAQYYSIYNLTVFDTFTNSWENINIEPDVLENSVTSIQFDRFLATVYNSKIIVLGGYAAEGGSNYFQFNNNIGILDFKSRSWSWSPIFIEEGTNYKSHTERKVLLSFNDQLIIFTDYNTEVNETPILIFDIPNKIMKSTLKLSNSSNIEDFEIEKNEAHDRHNQIPAYAIVLIAICSTVLLFTFIYYFYRRNKKQIASKNGKLKSSDPIHEVWSNPNIDNTINIITWDKKNGLSIKKNNQNILYPIELYPKLSNQSTSNMIDIN